MTAALIYTGRNGIDLLLASGAVEMEEDFSGDEIVLRMADGSEHTVKRGECFVRPSRSTPETGEPNA